jgi:hypothetical protein
MRSFTTFTIRQTLLDISWSIQHAYETMFNANKFSKPKPERKIPLERQRLKCENDIKIDLKDR